MTITNDPASTRPPGGIISPFQKTFSPAVAVGVMREEWGSCKSMFMHHGVPFHDSAGGGFVQRLH